MKRRLFLIVNPKSGTASIKNRILDIIETFVLWDFEVTVHTTTGPGDAAKQIKERAMDFDQIVCCGGDGIINEAFSSLAFMPDAPPLGLIPTGTTNDFSHSLMIPTDPLSAVRTVCEGTSFDSDCGLFGERVFTYAAAFGLFTNVTYETPQKQKNLLGRAAYVLEAIKNLPSYTPYHLEIDCDQGHFEGEYILGMITNTVSIGGFRKLFHNIAELDDGLLEVTLIKLPKKLADYQKVINVLIGTDHFDYSNSDFLTVISTNELRLKSKENIAWTLDGEEGGIQNDVVIKVLPNAVRVTVAKDSNPKHVDDITQDYLSSK